MDPPLHPDLDFGKLPDIDNFEGFAEEVAELRDNSLHDKTCPLCDFFREQEQSEGPYWFRTRQREAVPVQRMLYAAPTSMKLTGMIPKYTSVN